MVFDVDASLKISQYVIHKYNRIGFSFLVPLAISFPFPDQYFYIFAMSTGCKHIYNISQQKQAGEK